MALLERVSTLIRANLNDLIDKAEDPHKLIKQVILDIENQLIQVKTQMAVALADRHLLEKKRKEIEAKAVEWMQKAELAVEKEKDDLARSALERFLGHQKMAQSLKEQEADQNAQAEIMKSSLKTLGEKLAEVHNKKDLLLAQHRRARTSRSSDASELAAGEKSPAAAVENIENEAARTEAVKHIKAGLATDDVAEKFASLEKEDQVDRLLAEIQSRRQSKA
jgi:phage shock protein A